MKRIANVDDENQTWFECLSKASLWSRKTDQISYQWSQIMNRTKNEEKMKHYTIDKWNSDESELKKWQRWRWAADDNRTDEWRDWFIQNVSDVWDEKKSNDVRR
jgi:hypothetical protein